MTRTEMRGLIRACSERVLAGEALDAPDAEKLLHARGADAIDLFAAANRVRERFHGNRVRLCSILNAKSGRCGEDCAFCAQSAHHASGVEEYPLMDASEILEASRAAANTGAGAFSIVTSGRALDAGEFDAVVSAIEAIASDGRLEPDVSIGIIDGGQARRLVDAGCVRFHHNLEAARGFYPSVCTTRTWEDNVRAIRTAADAGLEICSGGIFGMGESAAQRVEMLIELRDLGVGSIPLNFLSPIEGTPLGGRGRMSPVEALVVVAVARLTSPRAHIRLCGGREDTLGGLQSWMFAAGANGIMTGSYLTTSGRAPSEDVQLLRDLELEWNGA